MKNKISVMLVFSLAIFLTFTSILFSQSKAYQIELKNVELVDKKTYEFEVYIKTPKVINISAYQCVFTYNKNIISNGILTFKYISGTSQMLNKPIKTKIIPNTNQMAFASGPSFEQIKSLKLIGKFRIKSTTNFIKKQKLNLQWYFTDGINTIITGTDDKNITKWFYFKPKNK